VTLDSPDILLYTVLFIVPGFIFHGVVGSFVPRKEEKIERLFLRYLLFGALNYALWFQLLNYTNTSDALKTQPWLAFLVWGAAVFVSPCILGLIAGVIEQKDITRRILQRMHLNPFHATPTAWDYKFSTTPAAWVQVWLKDGKVVRGLFNSRSFASSDPDERDLYIEQTCTVGQDGKWQLGPRNAAALVKSDQICYIEFLYNEGDQHEQRK